MQRAWFWVVSHNAFGQDSYSTGTACSSLLPRSTFDDISKKFDVFCSLRCQIVPVDKTKGCAMQFFVSVDTFIFVRLKNYHIDCSYRPPAFNLVNAVVVSDKCELHYVKHGFLLSCL